MISVVTAYFNRKKLFIRTLESMAVHFGTIPFEVIAVDDGSREEERLEDLVSTFPFLRILRLESQSKWYSNPCIPFNKGFEIAEGDKIILQNPECYHFDAILPYVDQYLKTNTYLSFGCFSLDKEITDNDTLFADRKYIESTIAKSAHVVKIDGGLGWYNHSKYRPAGLHFCTAIMAVDLVDLGGFDPRFAWGHGFDDDEFIFRVKLKAMKIKFVNNLRVLHQNHYTKLLAQDVKYENPAATRNKSIFENITKNMRFHRANYLSINSQVPTQTPLFSSRLRKIFIRLKYRLR